MTQFQMQPSTFDDISLFLTRLTTHLSLLNSDALGLRVLSLLYFIYPESLATLASLTNTDLTAHPASFSLLGCGWCVVSIVLIRIPQNPTILGLTENFSVNRLYTLCTLVYAVFHRQDCVIPVCIRGKRLYRWLLKRNF